LIQQIVRSVGAVIQVFRCHFLCELRFRLNKDFFHRIQTDLP